MAILWDSPDSEKYWQAAAKGRLDNLSSAFLWRSTEEGHVYWQDVDYLANRDRAKVDQAVVERIAYLYAEWKIMGDTDDGAY